MNDVTTVNPNLPAPVAGDDVFNSMAKSTGFKRIQLFGSNSLEVKKGDIPCGVFAVVDGSEKTVLGKSFDCLVLDWRPKAIRIEPVMEFSYDTTSDTFKAIQAESTVKDSKCMCGIEFLLWIPKEGFIPYYLSNKSSMYEAKPLRALIGKAATIKTILIEGKEFSWHAPKVASCSVPMAELPTAEDIDAEKANFRTPQATMAAMASEAEKDTRAH
jgi:hypothetical protein